MMRKLLLTLCLALGLSSPALAVVQNTPVGDANYTILITDTTVVTRAAFTAARTFTLPGAGATCVGAGAGCSPSTGPGGAASLQILDVAAAITSTNTLTITPASGDTINGNTGSLILSAAGVRVILVPTSGNNWQAEVYGDYVKATVASGSAVSLTTATAADVVTQSLSQGHWECTGTLSRTLGATTSVTALSASIGTTTNTIVAEGTSAARYFGTAANVMVNPTDTAVGPYRFDLTATTTMRLVAKDTFTVSTDAAYGELACVRTN